MRDCLPGGSHNGELYVAEPYGYSYLLGPDRRPVLSHGAEYRAGSRLLIVHGCLNDEKCGSYFLLMTLNGLKQLRYVPFDFDR